jgi:hypothetical protein
MLPSLESSAIGVAAKDKISDPDELAAAADILLPESAAVIARYESERPSKISSLDEPTFATKILLPSRAYVIGCCKFEGPHNNGFAYNEKVWIKYGTGVTDSEVAAQEFAHGHVDQRIFRVPQFYDWFSKGLQIYIIMERVDGISYLEYRKQHPDGEAGVFDAIITAIHHLWTFPVSFHRAIGPYRKGIPNDRFFSDYGAGRTFGKAIDLQEWCNAKLIATGQPKRGYNFLLNLSCFAILIFTRIISLYVKTIVYILLIGGCQGSTPWSLNIMGFYINGLLLLVYLGQHCLMAIIQI